MKVVGKCSDGELDHDGDIVSPAWMAQAAREFIDTFPAVRLQHRADYPVGKGLEAWQDGSGATWLRSLIVDRDAQELIKKNVLTSYSVGIAEPQTRQSAKARRWEIFGGRLAEVSLVDSPSNARCRVTVCKSVGGVPRYVGKAYVAGDAHGLVLKNCSCEACMAGRKSCGCPECRSVAKSVKAVRKMAARSGAAVEEMLRTQMRAALDSADPWQREMARKALSAGG